LPLIRKDSAGLVSKAAYPTMNKLHPPLLVGSLLVRRCVRVAASMAGKSTLKPILRRRSATTWPAALVTGLSNPDISTTFSPA
jgi:hypothetical protein